MVSIHCGGFGHLNYTARYEYAAVLLVKSMNVTQVL